MYQLLIENLIEKIDQVKDDQLINEQGLKMKHIVNNFKRENRKTLSWSFRKIYLNFKVQLNFYS